MDTPLHPSVPLRPSGLLSGALLGLAALAAGPSAQAQSTGLRLPSAMAAAGGGSPWEAAARPLALDAVLAGPVRAADYRIAPPGPDSQPVSSWLPRISVGLQQRASPLGGLAPGLRAGMERGESDLVIGATRMFLDQSLQLHGALRNTAGASPGFGPGVAGRGERQWLPELGVAWLLRGDLAIGAEYRFRTTGSAAIGFAEDDARDVYLAWTPRRDLSLSFGWTDQGRSSAMGGMGLSPRRSLTGFYVAGQIAF